MKHLLSTRAPFVGALTLALAVAVGASASTGVSAKPANVATSQSALGKILVDSQGHTLYLFGKDRNGRSSCTGMCATFWLPLIASGKPRVAGGAKASLIGTTKRADGRRQVTYNHHPLYRFVKDTRKGQTNGEGLKAFGGVWNAISPAGKKVVRHAAPSGIPQNNGGDHDSDNNGGPSDGDGNI
jgi:predicted lipoprotein with Yx(FWY)xxD motif